MVVKLVEGLKVNGGGGGGIYEARQASPVIQGIVTGPASNTTKVDSTSVDEPIGTQLKVNNSTVGNLEAQLKSSNSTSTDSSSQQADSGDNDDNDNSNSNNNNTSRSNNQQANSSSQDQDKIVNVNALSNDLTGVERNQLEIFINGLKELLDGGGGGGNSRRQSNAGEQFIKQNLDDIKLRQLVYGLLVGLRTSPPQPTKASTSTSTNASANNNASINTSASANVQPQALGSPLNQTTVNSDAALKVQPAPAAPTVVGNGGGKGAGSTGSIDALTKATKSDVNKTINSNNASKISPELLKAVLESIAKQQQFGQFGLRKPPTEDANTNAKLNAALEANNKSGVSAQLGVNSNDQLGATESRAIARR